MNDTDDWDDGEETEEYDLASEDLGEEVRRLMDGPDPSYPGGVGLMTVRVACPRGAPDVLARARYALIVILSHLVIGEGENAGAREMDPHTLEGLTLWFKSRISPMDTVDRLPDFSAARDWRWWRARVVDERTLDVVIEFSAYPISGFDSLRWLLQRCGAESVEQLR